MTTTHRDRLKEIFGGSLRATPKSVISSFPELFELLDDRVTSRTSSKPREELWAAQLPQVADAMEAFLRDAGGEMTISRFSKDLVLKKGPLWPEIKAVIQKKNALNIGDLLKLWPDRFVVNANTGGTGGTVSLRHPPEPSASSGTVSDAALRPRLQPFVAAVLAKIPRGGSIDLLECKACLR